MIRRPPRSTLFPYTNALPISGLLGLHIARLASNGCVTMVDASLAAVAAAQKATSQSGLTNVRVLPSDGAQAVISERFDLVVTNRSEEHTSELQSPCNIVCRLL